VNISADDLKAEVASALHTWPFIPAVEQAHGLPKNLLLAVGSRETNLRNVVGDGGHGHGVWQRDDRAWPIPSGYNADVERQANDAAALLASNIHAFGLAGGVAAYNCGGGNVQRALREGRPVDHYTTGGDYSTDVLARLTALTPPPQGGGMDTRAVQEILLKKVGQPIRVDGDAGPNTVQAIRYFQQGYGRGGTRLAVDGQVGPATAAALQRCADEDGRLSEHFRFREFACKHCGWIKVHWALPTALEQIRPPGGLSVVSGYRCPTHNREIGGASKSQHIYGTACDIPPIYTTAQILNRRLFSGIEKRSDGRVYHVDVRHALPASNFTGSSVRNPSVFNWG
jgi:hypothetical protein